MLFRTASVFSRMFKAPLKTNVRYMSQNKEEKVVQIRILPKGWEVDLFKLTVGYVALIPPVFAMTYAIIQVQDRFFKK